LSERTYVPVVCEKLARDRGKNNTYLLTLSSIAALSMRGRSRSQPSRCCLRGELGPVRYNRLLAPGRKNLLSASAAVAVADPDGISCSVWRTRATQAEANTVVIAAAQARLFSTGAHPGIDAKTPIGGLVDLYLEDLERDFKLLHSRRNPTGRPPWAFVRLGSLGPSPNSTPGLSLSISNSSR
jgi:hypothetical protein